MWTKVDWSQEHLDTYELHPMELALLTRLRGACNSRGGIPDSDLLKFADAARYSKHSFRKYWPAVKKFFTLRGDVWVHTEDQEQIDSYQEKSVKFQKLGEIGAAKRWHGQPVQAEIPFQQVKNTDSVAPSTLSERPSQKLEVRTTREVLPAASSTRGEPDAPAAAAPTPPKIIETPPIHYTKAVLERCVSIGLQVPDQAFIAKLWKKFPRIDPAKLPRFPDQRSPGLWLQKSEADLGLYIDTEATRKPALSAKQAAQEAEDQAALQMGFGRVL